MAILLSVSYWKSLRMGDKKRKRTARHRLTELDRIALGLAEEQIQEHNFERLVRDGVIVREKLKEKGKRDG